MMRIASLVTASGNSDDDDDTDKNKSHPESLSDSQWQEIQNGCFCLLLLSLCERKYSNFNITRRNNEKRSSYHQHDSANTSTTNTSSGNSKQRNQYALMNFPISSTKRVGGNDDDDNSAYASYLDDISVENDAAYTAISSMSSDVLHMLISYGAVTATQVYNTLFDTHYSLATNAEYIKRGTKQDFLNKIIDHTDKLNHYISLLEDGVGFVCTHVFDTLLPNCSLLTSGYCLPASTAQVLGSLVGVFIKLYVLYIEVCDGVLTVEEAFELPYTAPSSSSPNLSHIRSNNVSVSKGICLIKSLRLIIEFIMHLFRSQLSMNDQLYKTFSHDRYSNTPRDELLAAKELNETISSIGIFIKKNYIHFAFSARNSCDSSRRSNNDINQLKELAKPEQFQLHIEIEMLLQLLNDFVVMFNRIFKLRIESSELAQAKSSSSSSSMPLPAAPRRGNSISSHLNGN